MSDEVRLVEAVLFSAPRPVKVSEIVSQTLLPAATVRRAIRTLQKEYDDRGSAIEVAKVGDGYTLVLRTEYGEVARAFAAKEVPEEVLRTAAMVAYHQPVLQSDLAKTLGSSVYDHVRVLRDLGLIACRKQGQTLSLTTTKRFAEYFGIEGTKREQIKRWMESRAKDPAP